MEEARGGGFFRGQCKSSVPGCPVIAYRNSQRDTEKCRSVLQGSQQMPVHSAVGMWPGISTTRIQERVGPVVWQRKSPCLGRGWTQVKGTQQALANLRDDVSLPHCHLSFSILSHSSRNFSSLLPFPRGDSVLTYFLLTCQQQTSLKNLGSLGE